MPRIPTRILTSTPQGTSNPTVVTGRSLAPASSGLSGPAQPREQFRDRQQNRIQTAARQALSVVKARADADQQGIPGGAFTATVQHAVGHGLGRAGGGG